MLHFVNGKYTTYYLERVFPEKRQDNSVFVNNQSKVVRAQHSHTVPSEETAATVITLDKGWVFNSVIALLSRNCISLTKVEIHVF